MQPDLWFDFYPYNNPKAGARLVRLTKQQLLGGSFFRVERRGTGSGKAVLNSGQAEFTAANLHEENLVEVGDANISATAPLGGFFLHRGDFEVISADEKGGEDFPIGGPGLLAYAAREIMWSRTYITSGGAMDPFDDLWRFGNQGLWAGGRRLGAFAWRAVTECLGFQAGPYTHRHGDGLTYTDTHPSEDRLSSAISLLTMDFDQVTDSAGNAWTAYEGEFNARVKQQLLSVLLELVGKGMDVQLRGGRQLILSAYNSYGRDLRGSSFGAGVVRFAHGVNIANPARRAIEAGLNGSRALVGSNDQYARANSPVPFHVVRSIGLDSDAEATAGLVVDGEANLRAREAGSDVPALKVHYGNDPASGLYQFAPPEVGGHAWVGDLVTIHRGTGAFQWNNADARIEAIQFDLTDEKVWDDPTVEFGALYRSADERGRAAAVQAIAGKPHGPHIRLCARSENILRGLGNSSLKASNTDPGFPKSRAVDGNETTTWTPLAGLGPTPDHWFAADTGRTTTPGAFRYLCLNDEDRATAGTIYGATAASAWTWLTDNGGKLTTEPGANGWTEIGSWSGQTTSDSGLRQIASPGSYRYFLFRATAGGSGSGNEFDATELELWTNLHGGTSSEAARCDHGHWADEVAYDGGLTGSPATNVQERLDEIGAGAGASGETIVDVTDYGATGDGVTNDTAAFLAARAVFYATARAALYWPAGTYIIDPTDSDLDHRASGKRVFGDGRQSVIKSKAGAYSGTAIGSLDLRGTSTDPVYGVEVHHLTLDGNKANVSHSLSVGGEAFNLGWVHDSHLHDLWIINGDSEGLDIDDSWSLLVERVVAIDCGGTGIHASERAHNLRIVDSVAINCGFDKTRNGFDTWGASGAKANYIDFINCVAIGCRIGFQLAGDHGRLVNCTDYDSNTPYTNTGTGNSVTNFQAHKLAATVAPGVNDDTSKGFRIGSRWINTATDVAYICLDAAAGAAVWQTMGGDSIAVHDADPDAHSGLVPSTHRLVVLVDDGAGGLEPLTDDTGHWLYGAFPGPTY